MAQPQNDIFSAEQIDGVADYSTLTTLNELLVTILKQTVSIPWRWSRAGTLGRALNA